MRLRFFLAGSALLLAGTSSHAMADCLRVEEMADSAPIELTESEPCDLMAEYFLRFNGISRSDLLGLEPPSRFEHQYYVWLRRDNKFERSLDRQEKLTNLISSLTLLPSSDARKRASYEGFLLFRYLELHSDTLGSSEDLLAEILLHKISEAGFDNGKEMECLVFADAPSMTTDEILQSKFYQNCIESD